MSRAERLLGLLEALRRHRRPVRGQALADETGVSLRTLYRDIDSLRAQGAPVAGEAGTGYILQPGFTLPPLMFGEEEIEALVLGSRWVEQHGDARLAAAARHALAKIAAVVPDSKRADFAASALITGPSDPLAQTVDLAAIRAAIRRERRMLIGYRDAAGAASERAVWPFALAFFDRVRVLAAWCELRQAFRHFRTDRIATLDVTEARYPRRRSVLLQDWRAQLPQNED
jgi:predicted DNA-binding transcriptional regulator YafY